jgi:ribose-phosphate pyrophosphokinase
LVEAIGALEKEGIQDVYAAVSHGILSDKAVERINDCKALKKLVITDSIPLSKEKQIPKIHAVTVAPLLAEAVRRIHDEESISCLFDVA